MSVLVLGVLMVAAGAVIVGILIGKRVESRGWAAYIVRHGGLKNEPVELKREPRDVPMRNR